MYDNARGYAGSTYIAIGYQLQWGYSGYAVNFPISFDIVYNVLSIPQNTASTSNSYWGRFYITNLTKNGFTVSDTGAGSNRWLAIGKAQPQWGYQVVHGTNPVTYNLPISFTEQPFTVAISTGNGGNHASVNGFTCDSITLVAGTTPNVFDTIGYVIIGQ